MNLLDILLIILIISASALCIALIYYIWKISLSIKAIQENVSKLSTDLEPLIESTSQLANNLSNMSENARGQFDTSKSIVLSIKNRVDKILEFEEYVRKGIEGPVRTFIREITAINNGINTFLEKFRNKTN
ncbi:MAG: hypothetical protein JSW63_05575 [Ignavibacterium sp.]|nr:MAG: hypothetical protein JSW63_05575 [Ignavibacterium sp.]